jgi:hypothetical protein
LLVLPNASEGWCCIKCTNGQAQGASGNDVLRALLENQTKLIQELMASKGESATFLKRQTLQKLPSYSGNFAEWPKFKSIYDQTNREGNFSNAENACRLLEALKGPAKDLVEVKVANPDNVNVVMEELEKKFGNKENIYDCLIKDVLQAKSPRDNNNQTFENFAIKLSNLISNLEIMDMKSRLKDCRLIGDILKKLPQNQQERWFEYSKDKDTTDVTILNTFLQNRLDILRKIKVEHEPRQPATYSSRGNVHVQSEQYNTNRQNSLSCMLCKNAGHKMENCPDFDQMQINQRCLMYAFLY